MPPEYFCQRNQHFQVISSSQKHILRDTLQQKIQTTSLHCWLLHWIFMYSETEVFWGFCILSEVYSLWQGRDGGARAKDSHFWARPLPASALCQKCIQGRHRNAMLSIYTFWCYSLKIKKILSLDLINTHHVWQAVDCVFTSYHKYIIRELGKEALLLVVESLKSYKYDLNQKRA